MCQRSLVRPILAYATTVPDGTVEVAPYAEVVIFPCGTKWNRSGSKRNPSRGGVSKFFRCEAPFLLRHELECRITPSPASQKALTPPRLRASWQAPPIRYC